jgi:hypothetical protein
LVWPLPAAVLSVVRPSLALAGSFYLDLPAGPASAALLAIGVPLAGVMNGREDAWRPRPLARKPAAAALAGHAPPSADDAL